MHIAIKIETIFSFRRVPDTAAGLRVFSGEIAFSLGKYG
jgi:hypothetical protein